MDYGVVFIILACTVGLWMTWGVGANDLANVMSPAIGSRAVNAKQAILIAVIFEVAGAFLGGNEVSDTIRGGIIDMDDLTSQELIFSMLSVLFAGATWITVASFLGMPVSITNSIVGALVGVGAIMIGLHAIHWDNVGFIAASWIISPLTAGAVAFLLFISIRKWILNDDNPFIAAKYLVPIYLLLVGVILALMTSLKALYHFNIQLPFIGEVAVVILTVIVVFVLGMYAMRNFRNKTKYNRRSQYVYIEGMFSVLMALTACAMVFAHGSNDVAIAVGPVAGVISLVRSGDPMTNGWMLSFIMLAGCVGVIAGLLMYGRKVIATVGSSITTLTPSRGFAATLAASSTVVVSTSIGIPVSATQTLVGAVFGVGLARGIDALNLSVIRNIFTSWIITIPVAAFLATIFFFVLRLVFG